MAGIRRGRGGFECHRLPGTRHKSRRTSGHERYSSIPRAFTGPQGMDTIAKSLPLTSLNHHLPSLLAASSFYGRWVSDVRWFATVCINQLSSSVWGLAMAAYAERTPFIDLAWLMVKSIFGALILRSSACTVNDIFDRKYDAAVGK